MTSLPAGHFKFANRGTIKAGYAADLVVFDRETVADTATFEAPHGYAAGIPYVARQRRGRRQERDADGRAPRRRSSRTR